MTPGLSHLGTHKFVACLHFKCTLSVCKVVIMVAILSPDHHFDTIILSFVLSTRQ